MNYKDNFARGNASLGKLRLKIEEKLADETPDNLTSKLTVEELQDLDKILQISDFMLCKYADKKEMRDILKHYTSIITDTVNAITHLDDDVAELLLSAKSSICRIEDIHASVSEKSDLEKHCSDTKPEKMVELI